MKPDRRAYDSSCKGLNSYYKKIMIKKYIYTFIVKVIKLDLL